MADEMPQEHDASKKGTSPTPDNRPDALRVYLARAEVRLGTLHRIAGTLISGAGLLVLLPLFLKDALGQLVDVYIKVPQGLAADWIWLGALPSFVAFSLPLISIYLLLRELVLFYFSANIPGPIKQESNELVFHPRFAVTAIGLASDEGGDRRKRIREHQFSARLMNFVLPLNRSEKAWLTSLVSNEQTKLIALPENDDKENNLPDPSLPGAIKREDRARLRMAFGLAGAYDRDLEEECAKSELSLIRHNLLLRRLVIRYFKALILYIWTALILFAVTALLKTPLDKLIVVQIGLLVWSSLTPYWVRAPVRWIFREFEQGAPDDTRDPHLVNFERAVAWSCLFATVAGTWFLWVPLQQPFAILAIPGLILNVAVMLRSYHLLTSKLRWI